MTEVFNERQFVAAQRAWKASEAEGLELKTQKSLERLSATFFWASLGMGRKEGAGRAEGVEPARPAAEGVTPQRRA